VKFGWHSRTLAPRRRASLRLRSRRVRRRPRTQRRRV